MFVYHTHSSFDDTNCHHQYTGKYSTSLTQMKKALLCFQNRRSPSPQTAKPRIWARSLDCFRILLVSSKCIKLLTTLVANAISLFTYRSSIYAEVAFLMQSTCDITVLTMDHIILGATLRSSPNLVRQYFLPKKKKKKKDSLIRPEQFIDANLIDLRSRSTMFDLCHFHSLDLLDQTSASEVYASP